MSTRSIVRFNTSETKLTLYRHWDGYPAIGGATLARALLWRSRPCWLNGQTDVEPAILRVAQDLLGMSEPYLGHTKHDYEITGTRLDYHGDIEWRYEVSVGRDSNLRRSGSINIAVFNRSLSCDTWRCAYRGDLAGFVKFCDRDIADCNRNLMAREPSTLPEDTYPPAGPKLTL